MARTERIKSARKTKNGNRPRCCTCGVAIEIGQSYYKNSPSRFIPTYSWHATCKAPAPSQLESDDKRSTAMAAQEIAHESLDDLSGTENYDSLIDDIKSTLSACAAGFEEAAEMCRESASNIEDGFGHETESSMAQTEMADIYEEGASTLEDWEPDQTDVPGEDDVVDSDDPATDLTDLRNAWRDGVIESARQAIDDMEMPAMTDIRLDNPLVSVESGMDGTLKMTLYRFRSHDLSHDIGPCIELVFGPQQLLDLLRVFNQEATYAMSTTIAHLAAGNCSTCHNTGIAMASKAPGHAKERVYCPDCYEHRTDDGVRQAIRDSAPVIARTNEAL